MWPLGGPIFGFRGISWTNLVECYIPIIKALGDVVSDKKIFKVFILKIYFSLCDLDMQRTETIWTTIKEGHIRNIPAKFSPNPASS